MENNNISVLDYVMNRARNEGDSKNYEDPFIISGMDILAAEENVRTLREARWGFCSLGLARNGDPKLLIVDEDQFKASLEAERAEIGKIARIKGFFLKVAPIMADAMKELPGFLKPTLHELEVHRVDLSNQVYRANESLRDKLGFMMQSSRSRGANVDDLLQSPEWRDAKEGAERRINVLNNQIALCDMYLAKIKEIMS